MPGVRRGLSLSQFEPIVLVNLGTAGVRHSVLSGPTVRVAGGGSGMLMRCSRARAAPAATDARE